MKNDKTPQENFWAGSFGSEYINRNSSNDLLKSNVNFFSKALKKINQIDSCIEFGANIGMNIKALRVLYPNLKLNAVEINLDAVQELRKLLQENCVHHMSMLDSQAIGEWDMAFTKGVLIHINPEKLHLAYQAIVNASKRYILLAEYYNPSPVSIPYRGASDKLFKRDFAGEILELYPDISLLDYGFAYSRDPIFPQDDITWFLMEKATNVNS